MFSRRDFIQTSIGAIAASLCVKNSGLAQEYKTRPHKAIIAQVPTQEQMEQWLAWGVEGMELSGPITLEQAEQARKLADKVGFRIHSVMGGGSKERLEAASILGCDGALIVPGRVSGVAMPQPWEFKIQFDEKTNELISVVDGDNEPYKAYIAAHNEQMKRSREFLENLLPTAEKFNVRLCVENVWNNMWVKPEFAANFIRSFNSPFVKAYYDVGNHVKYSNPLDWFDVLGKDIYKIHLKDFKLNENGQGGRFVMIMEGSVDWKALRGKLEDIDYNGWMTVELDGGTLTIEEQARRMELILQGKPFGVRRLGVAFTNDAENNE